MPRPAATCSSVSSTPRTGYPALGSGLGGLRARDTVPDQRFAGQVGLGDLLLAGEPVSGGQYRYPRLGVQRGDAQAGLVDGQPHIADVDAAVEQHRSLVVPFDPLHVHGHVRVPVLERTGRRDDCNAGPETDHQPPLAAGGRGHPAADRVG